MCVQGLTNLQASSTACPSQMLASTGQILKRCSRSSHRPCPRGGLSLASTATKSIHGTNFLLQRMIWMRIGVSVFSEIYTRIYAYTYVQHVAKVIPALPRLQLTL